MNRIDIDGVQLEVAHIEGPTTRAPLVFLHEGLGSVSLWTQGNLNWPQALCEATGRQGWVYARRGYGRSDPIPDVRGPSVSTQPWRSGRHQADYMHVEAWEILPKLLHALDLKRPVLIGHSDGATIALLHATRHPVRACVAMAPHVTVEEVAIRAIKQARDAYLAPDHILRSRLARHHDDVDNAFWQWNDVWLGPAFRSFDIRNDCSRITAPLLLIQGCNDEYGTLQQLRDIEVAAPHAHTLELPDCGHSPHRDAPIAVTAGVSAFLAQLP